MDSALECQSAAPKNKAASGRRSAKCASSYLELPPNSNTTKAKETILSLSSINAAYGNGPLVLKNVNIEVPSGGTLVHDLTAFNKSVFGSTVSLDFTNIKGVVITANWGGPSGTGIPAGYPLSQMPHLTINTAGTDGFTDLLNGQDGYIKVGHKSSWSLVDFTGIPTSSSQKKNHTHPNSFTW